MLTSFFGKTRLFPMDKPRVPGKKKRKKNKPKSTSWDWDFCHQSSCPLPWRQHRWLVWCVCDSHTFTLNYSGVWCFISIIGWAATLFSQTDAALRQRAGQCRVKFWKVKSAVQYMGICTVHAAVQQHPYWNTYCTLTLVTCRLISIDANN